MRKTKQKSIVLLLCLSLLFSLFSGISLEAKKAVKVKKVEVRTTDSGVLVMKKKERRTLKLAVNGAVSKKAWKQLSFYSKNKKAVKINKKGKMTAGKKGKSKITIRAKKGKAKTTLKVIVGTKVQSVRMSAAAQELLVGGSVQLSAAVTPNKASYKKLRWLSSDPSVAVVAEGKVSAVTEGTATITAAALDGTKKKASCQIVVRKAGGSAHTPGTSETPGIAPSGSANPGFETSIPSTAAPEQPSTVPADPTVSMDPTASSDPTVSSDPTASAKPMVPGDKSTSKPGENPTTKPAGQTTSKPGENPTAKPAGQTTSQPGENPTTKPAGQTTSKPGENPTTKPAGQTTSKPGENPTTKPAGQSTSKPGENPTTKPTSVPTIKPGGTPKPTPEPVSLIEKEFNVDDETMTKTGTYTGNIGEPFAGIGLYANDDGIKTSHRFEGTNKKYRIIIRGASSNDTAAGVSLYIGDKKKGAVSFTGTELQKQVIDFKMQEEETGDLEIFFKLETDNGSNDTYLHSFELILLGDLPEPPAAPKPVGGAAYTNSYRNLFQELGHTEGEIDAKVEEAWQKFFYGTEEERIYYPVEPDMAYIYTADTNDVRSEGMSYGMMICVQMDKQDEFDRLWKWATTYMRHDSGEFKDYFAWQCSSSGSKMSNTPAPDGEEYFATALLFASARWGDGEGIYNYSEEAQKLLDAMRYHTNGSVTVNSIFKAEYMMPVFCPVGSAMEHTDTSYHLPAFYEVWALCDEEHSDFWIKAAEASRQHFKDATNETTGLGPDYANYDGSATGGNHADFRFDAWRIAANIACDYAWWGKDTWATTHADRIQSFFAKQGVEEYGNQWSLDGTMLDKDHSPGLVAMNATAGLAASDKQAWAFLENFWNISPTTGTYRYYDGCLYMMGLLHCSGKFRAYLPNGTKPAVSSTITADRNEFDKEESKQAAVKVTMTLNGNTLTDITCAGTSLAANKDYTIEGDVVTISKDYLASLDTGTVAISFVFSAGRKAVLSLKIKDTTPGVVPEPSGPFEQTSAAAFTDSNNVTVQDGIVTFNGTDSWIAFDFEFGPDEVKDAVVYVKESGYGGTVYVYADGLSSKISDIYNLGSGDFKQASGNCWPKPSAGQHKIYVSANKAGVQIQWLKFTK